MEELLRLELDREAVRAQYSEYLSQFPTDSRLLTKHLGTLALNIDEFESYFNQTFLPEIRRLDTKRTDQSLSNYLAKELAFSGQSIDTAVGFLVESRRQQVINDLVSKYCDEDAKKPELNQLFSRPADELDILIKGFANYQRALGVSKQHGLVLYDIHAPRGKRRKAIRKIKKDQRAEMRQEKSQLARNNHLLQQLQANNRLLKAVYDNGWNFVEVLGLRQDYEKKTAKFTPPQKPADAEKLVSVFETITKTFRKREAAKQLEQSGESGLQELSAINSQIYNLLLEVFGLPNSERNALMVDIGEYTKLVQENAQIAVAQQNRQRYLDNPIYLQ